MMKPIFIIIVSVFTTLLNAQCTISGNESLKTDEIGTFTIDSKAQCDDCYFWRSSSDQNLNIQGNNKSNKITTKALHTGKSVLSVSLLTNQGLVQCEKVINVVDTNTSTSQNMCGIKIDDYKDVKVSDGIISFFPNANSSDYTYKWTVTYINGDTRESTDKIPQFNYSDTNYISVVKLRISATNPLCAISITKKYDEYYWKPATKKIEGTIQKEYNQGSYSDYNKNNTKEER